MGHRDDGPLIGRDALFEGLCAVQIKVVSGLVKKQEGRAREFEEQNLESGLLPPGEDVKGALRGHRELVAVQGTRCLLPAHPIAMIVTAPEDLQQGSTGKVGAYVGLGKPARTHSGSQPGSAGVRDWRDDDLSDRSVLDIRVCAAIGEEPQ